MEFKDLVGLTLVEVFGAEAGSNEIEMKDSAGRTFRMWHEQGCCERVNVEEVHGDIADLIGTPILVAEESTNGEENKPSEHSDSWLWTFYRLQTIKGPVQIRWLGESNGYYSEGVDFEEVMENPAR